MRDRIPDMIRAQGRVPDVHVLSAERYAEALRAKLEEEVHELPTADTGEVLEEAADVFEVLLAMISVLGQTQDDLVDAARANGNYVAVSKGGSGWTADRSRTPDGRTTCDRVD